jgi:hypothetical protein
MANCAAPPVARDTCGTALENQISKPYAPVSAGLVAPHNETTGVPRAAAIWIKPVSGPTATWARAIRPRASPSDVRPTRFWTRPNSSSKPHPRSVGLPYHPTKSPLDYGFSRENPRNRPSDAETTAYSASEFRRTTQHCFALFVQENVDFFFFFGMYCKMPLDGLGRYAEKFSELHVVEHFCSCIPHSIDEPIVEEPIEFLAIRPY